MPIWNGEIGLFSRWMACSEWLFMISAKVRSNCFVTELGLNLCIIIMMAEILAFPQNWKEFWICVRQSHGMLESTPPLKNVPTGTSAIICSFTDSRIRYRSSSTTSDCFLCAPCCSFELAKRFDIHMNARVFQPDIFKEYYSRIKTWYDEPFADTSAFPSFSQISVTHDKRSSHGS